MKEDAYWERLEKKALKKGWVLHENTFMDNGYWEGPNGEVAHTLAELERVFMKKPKVGQKIFVAGSYSISHGSTDVAGGEAIISNVKQDSNGIWVEVREHPGHTYNWEYLKENQKGWAKTYKGQKACPDPDVDTPWLEEGDSYSDSEGNSGIYKGPPVW